MITAYSVICSGSRVPSQLAAWWLVSTDAVILGHKENDAVLSCFYTKQHNTSALWPVYLKIKIWIFAIWQETEQNRHCTCICKRQNFTNTASIWSYKQKTLYERDGSTRLLLHNTKRISSSNASLYKKTIIIKKINFLLFSYFIIQQLGNNMTVWHICWVMPIPFCDAAAVAKSAVVNQNQHKRSKATR